MEHQGDEQHSGKGAQPGEDTPEVGFGGGEGEGAGDTGHFPQADQQQGEEPQTAEVAAEQSGDRCQTGQRDKEEDQGGDQQQSQSRQTAQRLEHGIPHRRGHLEGEQGIAHIQHLLRKQPIKHHQQEQQSADSQRPACKAQQTAGTGIAHPDAGGVLIPVRYCLKGVV